MPLRGKTDEEIEKARAWQHPAAIELASGYFGVSKEECEILPTFITDAPEDAAPLWYFGKGIMDYLSKSDILVLAPDYEDARGCRCEQYVAEEYDIPYGVLGDKEE
jgi:hypothetical protein